MKRFLKKIFALKKNDAQDNFFNSNASPGKSETEIENSENLDENTFDYLSPTLSFIDSDEIVEEKENTSIPKKNYDPTFDLPDYIFPQSTFFCDSIRSLLNSFQNNLLECKMPVVWSIGNNNLIIKDLSELANVLIAGSQESGKTSFIHQLIISLLLNKHPAEIKFVVADIKELDLGIYKDIEKHFLALLPGLEDTLLKDPKNLIHSLNSLCIEMDNRYDLLVNAEVRNIKEYNTKFVQRELNPENGHQFLPDLIFIIDDLGLYTYQGLSQITSPLVRLVSEGYKAGIYTIISTSQTNILSLPNNLLSMIQQRVVFRLNSKGDYRRFFETSNFDIPVVSGEFLYNENIYVRKGKSLLVSIDDIKKMVEFIHNQKGYGKSYFLPDYIDESKFESKIMNSHERDPLFEEAARLIVLSQSGSTSLLQRKMKLGYNRVGKIMDQLEAAGIVGPSQGSRTRDVLIKTDLELHGYI